MTPEAATMVADWLHPSAKENVSLKKGGKKR